VHGPNNAETNIFKMQSAGGDLVQVTYFDHAMTTYPAWSPDGQRIAFVCDQNGTPRVWVISANGGTPQVLEKTNPSNTAIELSWWPSNDIVYQKEGNRNFLRVNEKTQEAKPIILHEAVGWIPNRPVFSPDGKKIGVWWNRGIATGGLWIISLEPYSETRLLSGAIYPLGWSSDGKYVYANRERSFWASDGEIIRVQVATPNEVTPVATLPGGITNDDGASVSPDGKEIVVSISEEKSDVWLMENFDPSGR
jgi:Tol biopolymer transport system component